MHLVKETKNLSTRVLSSGLFVVHDAGRGGQDNESKLTRREQVINPSFNFLDLDVEPGRDDATLVQTTDELDDNFARTMVIHNFKLTNVAYAFPKKKPRLS